MTMTNFEWLRERLEQRAGLHLNYTPPYARKTFADIHAQECSDGFTRLMDNRIVMGHLRYGPMKREKRRYADVYRCENCLEQYWRTGNLEYLVDAANYCRLEFIRSRHPLKHFTPVDRK